MPAGVFRKTLPPAGQRDGAGEGESDEVEHHDAVDDEEGFHCFRDGAGSGGLELEQGSCRNVKVVEDRGRIIILGKTNLSFATRPRAGIESPVEPPEIQGDDGEKKDELGKEEGAGTQLAEKKEVEQDENDEAA